MSSAEYMLTYFWEMGTYFYWGDGSIYLLGDGSKSLGDNSPIPGFAPLQGRTPSCPHWLRGWHNVRSKTSQTAVNCDKLTYLVPIRWF